MTIGKTTALTIQTFVSKVMSLLFNICVLFDHFALRKAMTNIDNIFKKQRHYFADKGLYSQNYGFSSNRG